MNSFANMLNRKIFVKSAKTSYIAVEQVFLVKCLEDFVGKIYVDEAWYLEVYSDIREAVAGKTYSAKEHYTLHGYYEHRMPYKIQVDETWYLTEYDDIRQAVADGIFVNGQMHFTELGYKEGRFPFPNFALKQVGDMPAA